MKEKEWIFLIEVRLVRVEETKCVLALCELELGMLGNSHCVLG